MKRAARIAFLASAVLWGLALVATLASVAG